MAPDPSRPTPRAGPVGRAGFADVVNAHWPAVWKLLHSLTGNRHDTEDLTQETFLRALNRIETFKADTSMRPWLLRIAVNAFYDQQRRRKRLRQQPLPDDVPGPDDRPEVSLESAEQQAMLAAALGELSELTRLVFHLRTHEELSFRDIGDMAGIREDAARWHMRQARVKLMSRLAGKL